MALHTRLRICLTQRSRCFTGSISRFRVSSRRALSLLVTLSAAKYVTQSPIPWSRSTSISCEATLSLVCEPSASFRVTTTVFCLYSRSR
ncbi:hypothetical protein BDZ85DRAFT_308471 [Elsinoe ampelina]|uniref:Uncharacterized protein n=1 Tax=Elsinoe ampelina TaxID=302913 RepID=A0A6A6FYW5_9PEZI|nr:hypothetical protein BDZ85DRAFT_308471 [Elsinoe ampelina]